MTDAENKWRAGYDTGFAEATRAGNFYAQEKYDEKVDGLVKALERQVHGVWQNDGNRRQDGIKVLADFKGEA